MNSLDASIQFLLIEDDQVDAQDIQRTFKKNKIANPLHLALNGLEALNMLRGENDVKKLEPMPTIILLDINMPKMNGIEFLKELRSDPKLKSLLVFVLTSSNDERDKIDAYKLNVAGYILKPLKFAEFAQSVSVLNLYWALLEFPNTQ